MAGFARALAGAAGGPLQGVSCAITIRFMRMVILREKESYARNRPRPKKPSTSRTTTTMMMMVSKLMELLQIGDSSMIPFAPDANPET